MAALEARLGTARADRYLAQLTSHMAHGPGGLTVLSTSADELVVDLGTATWSVRAGPQELVLRLDAEDPAELDQQSARVAHRVEQIARRDGLQVVWQPA
ncbi:hypothetical protein EV651_105116 [Kribbella sp. VKM Ac-2571]|uniref:DUF2218 domain-containing protein n=1 Tax=Kribbella sp. VKM Ac-2571 TaxID=2512222 RepID=UPI00105D4681|nr:DUF2218 domain-containing protein [Kribbella sp. VKM Ac-2571]TDO63893.1 hypothetical protein EV651_105116 [Kribbella sp. VKM Ac-2571]